MWEDNDAEDEDEDEEDEGLAGQLLSELIASNKYGTINFLFFTFSFCRHLAYFIEWHICKFLWFFIYVTDDDYYEDDEEDDPDALKDPIYQIDLQVHSF